MTEATLDLVKVKSDKPNTRGNILNFTATATGSFDTACGSCPVYDICAGSINEITHIKKAHVNTDTYKKRRVNFTPCRLDQII